MKVLLLANPNSIHTIKWAKSLSSHNIDLLIFGLGTLKVDVYKENNNITVKTLNQDVKYEEGLFSKIKYLKVVPQLNKIIKQFKPDILHAHYASSYGFLGALLNFSPFVISVWGSDVFDFPKNSFIHKSIFKYNMRKADKILSTSHVMAKEILLYTNKEIDVTPFGIDVNVFKPKKVKSLFKEDDIVIGTIKSLEPVYGIEYLIKTFKLLVDRNKELPLKLLIVGTGSLESKLKKLTELLEIKKKTLFVGGIKHSDVPKYINMISIFVALSIKESFGVSVIEANSCEKPVVVSDAGGLIELVKNNITGFVVPAKNPEEAANTIEKLLFDDSLNMKMGKAGRKRVKKLYNWNNNVQQMINIYKNILNKK